MFWAAYIITATALQEVLPSLSDLKGAIASYNQ